MKSSQIKIDVENLSLGLTGTRFEIPVTTTEAWVLACYSKLEVEHLKETLVDIFSS